MKKHVPFGLLGILAVMMSSCQCQDKTDSGTAPEKIAWSDRVIPLPREIAVAKSAVRRADEILLEPFASDDPKIATAATLIRHFALARQGGNFIVRMALASNPGGSIPAGIIERLAKAPNKDQAYAIIPSASPEGVALIGNTPLGVLYAARTFAMLVQAPEKTDAATTLAMPLASVFDWPDMEERGFWGIPEGDITLEWYNRWKLNMREGYVSIGLTTQGAPYLSNHELLTNAIAEHASAGVKFIPYLPHIAVLGRSLRAAVQDTNLSFLLPALCTPDPAKQKNPFITFKGDDSICPSSPVTVRLLTDLLMQMAEIIQGYHNDLEVWLTEEPQPCFCDACRGKNEYELETAALLKAFETVRIKYPETRLRIWTTQGSHRDADENRKILKMLPPGVGIGYYNGTLTYTTSYEPLIYPALEEFARQGGFLGVVPQITSNMRIIVPWTAPQFIQMRAQEFVDKQLRSVSAYSVPGLRWHEFNVVALAEWTWNAHGRSPEAFARAYATVTGMDDPDLFARWAVRAGEAGMELAESGFIGLMRRAPGSAAGSSFRDKFKTARLADPAKLQHALKLAREADVLARQANQPLMTTESAFTLGELEAFDALWTLAGFWDNPTPDEAARRQASEALDQLDCGAQAARSALTTWGLLMAPPGAWHERLSKTIPALLRVCDAARNRATSKGIADPRPESRIATLRTWSVADFNNSDPSWSFDLTNHTVRSGGAYHVTFDLTDGYAPWVTQVVVFGRSAASAVSKPVARAEMNRPNVGTPRYRYEECRLVIPPIPVATTQLVLNVALQLDSRIRKAMQAGTNRVVSGAVGWRRVYETNEFQAVGLEEKTSH